MLWYLFANEVHNSDGRHISYLENQSFATLDPELHESLKRLMAAGRRSVKAIAGSSILPENTIYFESPIAGPTEGAVPLQQRVRKRASWLKRALKATSSCDLVFFDPDNGLETASVARHSPKGGKYVYWDELSPFWDRGQSLIIYHHLNRTAPVAKQTEILQEKFAAKFGSDTFIRSFLFRRGSCRHFWLVAQKRHARHCRSVIEKIDRSEWRKYFTVG